jgi:hypothetical protein
MRFVVWLAFISVMLYGALKNFENFAARPSLPQCWIDVKAEEARNLAHQIDSEPDGWDHHAEDYMWLLLESRQRKEAHDVAALLNPPRPDATGYDTRYVHRLHRLAVAELMHDCSDDMVVTLQHVYDYDRKYLPPGDIRISRDCNNLGLACFLLGQNTDDEGFRVDMLNQAAGWFEKAQSGFPAGAKIDIVSVLENKLMLAEALHNQKQADSLHKQIDQLLAEIGGPAPNVIL